MIKLLFSKPQVKAQIFSKISGAFASLGLCSSTLVSESQGRENVNVIKYDIRIKLKSYEFELLGELLFND